MNSNKLKTDKVLKQIDVLERELVRLKRDILHGLVFREKPEKMKASLFGSIKGGDITEEMIEESKSSLFRNSSNDI